MLGDFKKMGLRLRFNARCAWQGGWIPAFAGMTGR